MKGLRPLIVVVVGTGLLSLGSGCGGGPEPASPVTEANAKVEAIKRLADAMAKDPNGFEARAALEDFQVAPFDPRATPDQAAEILEVYRTRIQGKYRGEVAQQLQGQIAGIQAGLKRGK